MAGKRQRVVEVVEDAELDLEEVELRRQREKEIKTRLRTLRLEPRLARKIADLADIGIEVALDGLAELEWHAGSPVFNPAPKIGDRRRLLIDLNKMSREQILEWMQRQGTRSITISLDSFEEAKLNSSIDDARLYRDFFFHGVRWPVPKGEAVEVPWPLAEMWDEVGNLRKRRSQFANLPVGTPVA